MMTVLGSAFDGHSFFYLNSSFHEDTYPKFVENPQRRSL